MTWHAQAALGALACLLVATAGSAQEIPLPAGLDQAEPRVRDKVLEFRASVVADPSNGNAWGRYGMVLDAHRYSASARRAYEQAHRLSPDEFRWPYYTATLLHSSEPQLAVSWFERALALDPGYAPLHVRFAETLESLGRWSDARRHFQRAKELEPTDHLAHFGLGRLSLRDQSPTAAVAELERAYQLSPDTQSIVVTLARAYRQAGRLDLARQKAEEARHLPRMTHHRDPRRAAVGDEAVDNESYLRRSLVYRQVGQLERSRSELVTLLEQDADQEQAWLALAGVEEQRGDLEASLRATLRALDLAPDLRLARSMHARVLTKLGRFQEAEARCSGGS